MKVSSQPDSAVAADVSDSIRTKNLTRKFGRRLAVRGLNFSVPSGSIYGFLGLNGAGKSTTIRMLMGLLTPTDGEISVLGLDPQKDDIAVKRRVGYVPDSPVFYDWMTVRELLAFVAHYRKREWDDRRARHLVKTFKLPMEQKLRTLSKGQRSRVSLTLALSFNPDLLILDEPTGGLDPIARRQFIEGVLAEFMEGNRTILISSHLINEISGLVDHFGILHNGELVMDGRVDDFIGSMKRVRLFYEGLAPRAFDLEGLTGVRTNGHEAELILKNFSEETSMPQLQQLGARQIEVHGVSLEDAFVEVVGQLEAEEPVSPEEEE
jgi:ABC-2 type transport system ATP-binding protein